MIVDVLEMVLVAIGAVLTAVLIWLLMRKYDRDHPVATSLGVRSESNMSPASPSAKSPASPTTMSPSDTAKPDAVVASDTAAGASVGGSLVSPDSKDVLMSHPFASTLARQEVAQTAPPSDTQPQSISSDEALHTEKPAESQPVGKPSDSKQAEKPAESKPAKKPAESKPAEKPAESRPAEKHVESKPAEKPADGKAAEQNTTNLRSSSKQRRGSRGSAGSGLSITRTKEHSERDQRKRKLKKSFGVTSPTTGDASAMKSKRSKRKLAKAAPSDTEVKGVASSSAASPPMTPGSGAAGQSSAGSPQAVESKVEAEVAERPAVPPEGAARAKSDKPKEYLHDAQMIPADDLGPNVAYHGQSPTSLERKQESKHKPGKVSLSPTAASAPGTTGVVSSSHAALSPSSAGTGESNTSPGVGPPTTADPNVQELRAMHVRRASRVPQAAFPAERRKSEVPRVFDIFSVEHSNVEPGGLKASPHKSKPAVPSPPPPK